MALLGPQELLLLFIMLIIIAAFIAVAFIVVWSVLQFMKGKREDELEARVKKLEKRLKEKEQKQ
jgi:uncharacterized membrane protein YqiK